MAGLLARFLEYECEDAHADVWWGKCPTFFGAVGGTVGIVVNSYNW